MIQSKEFHTAQHFEINKLLTLTDPIKVNIYPVELQDYSLHSIENTHFRLQMLCWISGNLAN